MAVWEGEGGTEVGEAGGEEDDFVAGAEIDGYCMFLAQVASNFGGCMAVRV